MRRPTPDRRVRRPSTPRPGQSHHHRRLRAIHHDRTRLPRTRPHRCPLYALDWILKPSGEAWLGQVYGKWGTNSTATTNGSGSATINGFLGRYASPNNSSDAFWLSVNGESFQNVTVTQGATWHWVLWKQAVFPQQQPTRSTSPMPTGGTSLNQVLITDDLSFTP